MSELGTPSLTAEFWAAARARTLVRPLCDDCGRSFFTPQIACRYCWSENWHYEPSNGRGRLYSYTVCHRPPTPDFDVPYVIGIVDLDGEGWSMLTNIHAHEPDALELNMELRVDWLTRASGDVLPVFVPVR